MRSIGALKCSSGSRASWGTHFIEHRAHLRAQRGGVTVVVDHMMRGSALLVKWPLGIFPAGEVRGGPATGGMDAGKPRFQRGIHKNHRGALGIQPHLKEEGGVNDKGPGARGRGGEDFGPALGDPGVEECLQARALGWGVEDDGGDEVPIDRGWRAIDLRMTTMAITNAVAPPGEKLATNDRIVVRVVRDVIAVGDDAAEGREDACDRGFPRAGSTGEAEGWGGGGATNAIRMLSILRLHHWTSW